MQGFKHKYVVLGITEDSSLNNVNYMLYPYTEDIFEKTLNPLALYKISFQDMKVVGRKNKKELELLAQGLLEYETLSGEDIKKVINGEKIERKEFLIKKLTKKSQMPTADDVADLSSEKSVNEPIKKKTRSRKKKETES